MYRSPAVALTALSCLTASSMASEPPSRSRTFHLDAPLAQVFPLFTAEGERAWAEGWEPRILSGSAHRGSVFITNAHDGRTVTWIVTDYRPEEGRVSYARLAQDSNMGLIDVTCTSASAGGTDVTVRYTLTAVNTAAQQYVANFLDEQHYSQMIEDWRVATSKALQRARGR
jgi:Polyketide cyclase / dehydrase and lipid transport